jgi:alcohol dehydrogenase
MNPFDLSFHFRVISSPGASGKAGEVVRSCNARRVMVVMDPGIERAGLHARLFESLKRHQVEVSIFTEVQPNPTTLNVEAGVKRANEFSPDMIIALGGGSSIDTAKAVNMLRICGGKLTDYRAGLPAAKLPPLMAIPTTAGTGAEVTPFILISDSATHAKIVLRGPQMIPRISILDATLTTTLPRQVTTDTGIDALVHSVEAIVAKGSPLFSQALGLESLGIIYRTLPLVIENPANLEGREKMLAASNMAGLAFAYSYLGLSHSLSNPLTRVAGMAHGMAVGMVLPYVILFNYPAAPSEYAAIAARILGNAAPADPKEAAGRLAAAMKEFLRVLGYPPSLREAGISRDRIPEMAEEAILQPSARANPREATLDEIKTLYYRAYEGEEVFEA